jgi:membrane protein
MFCSKCGKQLGDTDRVCGFCGEPVYIQSGSGVDKQNIIKSVTGIEKIDYIRKIAILAAILYIITRTIGIVTINKDNLERFLKNGFGSILIMYIGAFIMILGLIKLNSRNKIMLAMPKILFALSSITLVLHGIIETGDIEWLLKDFWLWESWLLRTTILVIIVDHVVVFILLCIITSSRNKNLVRAVVFVLIIILLRHAIVNIYSIKCLYDDLSYKSYELSDFSKMVLWISYFIYEICIVIILWRMSVCGSPAYVQQISSINSNMRGDSKIEVQESSCYKNVENNNIVNQQDKPSFGLNILAFCIPIIGLTLYLALKNTYPKKANSIGKTALIGAIVWTTIYILIKIFSEYILYWFIMYS